MDLQLWEAALGAGGAVAGATAGGLFNRKNRREREVEIDRARAEADRARAEAEERRENSAKLLLESYGLLLDEYKDRQTQDRTFIDRLSDEQAALRREVRELRSARDSESASLRGELAAVRSELATVREELRLERDEKKALHEQMAAFQAGRRSSDQQ